MYVYIITIYSLLVCATIFIFSMNKQTNLANMQSKYDRKAEVDNIANAFNELQ